MRRAALLVALVAIVAGTAGLVSPDMATSIRRLYFATPVGLYSAGAVRVAMALVVILCAPASRAPKTLRLLGGVMWTQGIAAMVLGPERARVVLEWEAMQGAAILRVGASIAVAAGGLIAFAVTGRRASGSASAALTKGRCHG